MLGEQLSFGGCIALHAQPLPSLRATHPTLSPPTPNLLSPALGEGRRAPWLATAPAAAAAGRPLHVGIIVVNGLRVPRYEFFQPDIHGRAVFASLLVHWQVLDRHLPFAQCFVGHPRCLRPSGERLCVWVITTDISILCGSRLTHVRSSTKW